jgi:hypothetical protein
MCENVWFCDCVCSPLLKKLQCETHINYVPSLLAQNITELTLKGGVDIATKFFFKYQDDPQIFDYTTFVFSRLALHSTATKSKQKR